MTTLDQVQGIADELVMAAVMVMEARGEMEAGVFFVMDGKVSHVVRLPVILDSAMAAVLYERVSLLAIAMDPEAVVTVNLGYAKQVEPGEAGRLRAYGLQVAKQLKVPIEMDSTATQCLSIAMKGKAIGSWFFYVQYEKGPLGDVIWNPATPRIDARGAVGWIDLVEDWWNVPGADFCDFCGADSTVKFSVPTSLGGDEGQLRACATCDELIRARRLQPLVDRSVKVFSKAFPNEPAHRIQMVLVTSFAQVFSYLDGVAAAKRAQNN